MAEHALAEEAVDQIVRAALRSIAAAADEDALSPGSERAVETVVMGLIAEAAVAVPIGPRIKLLNEAREVIGSFTSACAAESA